MLERRRLSSGSLRSLAHPGLAAALLLGTAPAFPHGLEVFAYAEGARIQGSARFAGATAGGIRILVKDSAGSTLAELTPAADGSFTYEARGATDHRIVAQSVDGHRAEWRVTADELSAGFPIARDESGTRTAAEALMPRAGGAEASNERRAPAAPASLDPLVEAAIGRAVARQVGPLRQELAAARKEARLQDVLGGIGYIVGIAGLALWWRGRRADGLDRA